MLYHFESCKAADKDLIMLIESVKTLYDKIIGQEQLTTAKYMSKNLDNIKTMFENFIENQNQNQEENMSLHFHNEISENRPQSFDP